MRKAWGDKRVMQAVRRIDARNQEVCDIIRDIRESRHPLAELIADELSEQCEILACARDVVETAMTEARSCGECGCRAHRPGQCHACDCMAGEG